MKEKEVGPRKRTTLPLLLHCEISTSPFSITYQNGRIKEVKERAPER
jgi:hypothetical protein